MKVVAVGNYIFFRKKTLTKLNNLVYFRHIKKNPDNKTMHEAAESADVLITYADISPNFIYNHPRLQAIIVMTAGKENLERREMLKAMKFTNTTIMYTPNYSTRSVAEFTFAGLLSLQSGLLPISSIGNSNIVLDLAHSQRKDFSDLKFGIVGFGNVGQYLTKLLCSINASVLVYTRNPQLKDLSKFSNFKMLNRLIDIAKNSDLIAITCSLNSETEGFLNEKAFFNKLKNDIKLINTARGRIFEPKALYKFLKNNPKSSLVIDVLDFENNSFNEKIKLLPNVFVTPHIAFNSLQSLYNCTDKVLENLQGFINGKMINCIN